MELSPVAGRQCTKCEVDKPLTEYRANRSYHDGHERQCRECRAQARRERYHAAPARERELQDKWAAANRDRINARARERRLAALVAYSGGSDPCCHCCGEGTLQFLSLDHIDGGGRQHRKRTGGGGFYSWLRQNGYPPGFQVMCHNCNLGRQLNGGTCPHARAVLELVGA